MSNQYVGAWSNEELDFIKNNYLQLTNRQLGEQIGRSEKAIEIKLHRLQLKRPDKYIYNKRFFQNIDTEEKAYWYGFLYADGYITEHISHDGSDNYEMGLELQEGDYKHLKKFNKSLNGNVQVSYRTRYHKEFNKNIKTCLIRLYSKDMVNDLRKLGFTQNKTYDKMSLPKLDDDLMRHFLRGYFDGDGCVIITRPNKKNEYSFVCDYCSANEVILTQIRDYLFEKYNIKSYIMKEADKTTPLKSTVPTYRLKFAGLINSNNFLSYLYDDCHIYLDRKYNYYKYNFEKQNMQQRIDDTISLNRGLRERK